MRVTVCGVCVCGVPYVGKKIEGTNTIAIIIIVSFLT